MAAALDKKNTIQQTGFALTDNGFTYCLKFYRFEDVTETRIIKSVLEHKVIFVGSDYHYSISIIIGMKSGELLQVTEQPTWLSNSKMNNAEYIESIFSKISRESYHNRFYKYTSSIKRTGYFDYNGWRFCTKNREIKNISNGKFYRFDSVNFIKRYGFIEIRSSSENIFEIASRALLGTRTGIETLIDTDIFFILIMMYFGKDLS